MSPLSTKLLLPRGTGMSSVSSLDNGLVSAWNFNGDGADALGNNSFGLVNSPTFQAGKIGQDVGCSRADNRYLSAARNATQDFTNQFSTSLWVKLASTNFLSRQALLSKWNASLAKDAWYWYLYDVGAIQAHFVLGTDAGPNDVLVGSIDRDAWVHLVSVYDGTQSTDAAKLVVYISGAAQDVSFGAAVPSVLQVSLADLQFGNLLNATSGDYAFDGEADAVAMWNRPLTADEVATLYNAGAGLEYPF